MKLFKDNKWVVIASVVGIVAVVTGVIAKIKKDQREEAILSQLYEDEAVIK